MPSYLVIGHARLIIYRVHSLLYRMRFAEKRADFVTLNDNCRSKPRALLII